VVTAALDVVEVGATVEVVVVVIAEVVVVVVGVLVVVDELQDAKTSEIIIRLVSATQIIPLFIQTSSFHTKFREIDQKFIFKVFFISASFYFIGQPLKSDCP
jgi:hypothetical protein